jgi:hypothetical protein
MRILTLLLSILLAGAATAAAAHADSIQNFSLDSTSVSGTTKTLEDNSLTVVISDITIGGVTFDAGVRVTGSSDLTQTSSGIGVGGDSSALFNAGEMLTFAAFITNQRGGTACFGGFTALDFTFFTTAGEIAIFSDDTNPDTADDNWLTHTSLSDPDISATSPLLFNLFAANGTDDDGSTVKTSFRIDSIQASFDTVSAVPEPGSFALVGLGCIVAWVARRRGRRR